MIKIIEKKSKDRLRRKAERIAKMEVPLPKNPSNKLLHAIVKNPITPVLAKKIIKISEVDAGVVFGISGLAAFKAVGEYMVDRDDISDFFLGQLLQREPDAHARLRDLTFEELDVELFDKVVKHKNAWVIVMNKAVTQYENISEETMRYILNFIFDYNPEKTIVDFERVRRLSLYHDCTSIEILDEIFSTKHITYGEKFWLIDSVYRKSGKILSEQAESLLINIISDDSIDSSILFSAIDHPNATTKMKLAALNSKYCNEDIVGRICSLSENDPEVFLKIATSEFATSKILLELVSKSLLSADVFIAALEHKNFNKQILDKIITRMVLDSKVILAVANSTLADSKILLKVLTHLSGGNNKVDICLAVANNKNANSLTLCLSMMILSELSNEQTFHNKIDQIKEVVESFVSNPMVNVHERFDLVIRTDLFPYLDKPERFLNGKTIGVGFNRTEINLAMARALYAAGELTNNPQLQEAIRNIPIKGFNIEEALGR